MNRTLTRTLARTQAIALRHALAAVPLACAALLGAPQARAATMDVPCGQAINANGFTGTIVLQACRYPLMSLSGSIVVEGNGAVIDLAPATGPVYAAGAVTLRDLRITGGAYGAMQLHNNVTLERVVVSGNSTNYRGGGILAIDSLVSLTLIDTTISGNSAPRGGGMWLKLPGNAKVKIVRSTFDGNRAVSLNDGDSGVGGGFEIVHTPTGWSLEIANSTFSGNSAAFYGGAMMLQGTGSATISDTTMTGNSAGIDGDAIGDNSGGVADSGLHIRRSVIAGNGSPGVADCGFGFADFKQDYGYNVVVPECVGGAAKEATTKVIAANGALLGALANNGGSTMTHLPMAGSPVLDMIAAGSTGCTTGTVDQRGVARPQNGQCDAGAVEVAAVSVYPFSGFYTPVDNLPTANKMKGGAAVPVKFSLGGDRGLDIFAAGYPQSQQVGCGSAGADVVELTVVAATSKLSYDSASDSYVYAWKTDRAWRGTCRLLTMRLKDGTDHQALFRFK